jgi:hypothetical protein
MHPTIRGGFLLGASVAAWTLLMATSGLYKHPTLFYLFWLVIPIQIGILIHFLRLSAPTTGYGRQVWTGVSISLLGSMLIFANSYYLTTVQLPHYFQDMEVLGRQLMANKGMSPEQIEAAVKAQAHMQTPMASAMAGAIGTVVTGFFTSVIAAFWLRKK